jgi:hypothetical protein
MNEARIKIKKEEINIFLNKKGEKGLSKKNSSKTK